MFVNTRASQTFKAIVFLDQSQEYMYIYTQIHVYVADKFQIAIGNFEILILTDILGMIWCWYSII